MTETTEAESPEETALYRIRGEAGLLLYIGISKDFGRRWWEHARKQPWWAEMRSLSADEWFDFRSEAEAAEEAAIKAEKPKYNKRHLVPTEHKSRKARAVTRPPARPAAARAVVATVAELPSPRDESCKVPYPYSLLSFALPGHRMDGIDLGTPDGRFQAAEAFSAYEKQALDLRSFLEKEAAKMLEMEQDPDLQWAIPALRKIRRNCATLIGDGSSLAMDGARAAGDTLRENMRLTIKLANAMGVIADALKAVDAAREVAA